ncbi:hypothetical protein LguiA_000051 [Lonicera macranthoides]
MKVRNKGKVYPSPSLTCCSPPNTDALSVLNLLPTAILALASVLSLQDKEVLAYMITRSLKSTNPVEENKKKSIIHKPPLFDCDCFDCYTSYWFRWDSSPNRELIHQAIEAFEEHLSNGEISKKKSTRGKRRDKIKPVNLLEVQSPQREAVSPEKCHEPLHNIDDVVVEYSPKDLEPVVVRLAPANNDKGLARKVLPDVLGLFNSRLWSLWSPNA